MKKLNRKGFTLVELLAVIVILAIVVGITMVTVLPTLSNARQNAFELTAQTAADFLEKEYQLYLIGDTSTISSELVTGFGKTNAFDSTKGMSFTKNLIVNAGLKPENYVAGTWYINKTTGRACVKLYASTNTTANKKVLNYNNKAEAGEYYDAKDGKSATLSVKQEGSATAVDYKMKYSLASSSGC